MWRPPRQILVQRELSLPPTILHFTVLFDYSHILKPILYGVGVGVNFTIVWWSPSGVPFQSTQVMDQKYPLLP